MVANSENRGAKDWEFYGPTAPFFSSSHLAWGWGEYRWGLSISDALGVGVRPRAGKQGLFFFYVRRELSSSGAFLKCREVGFHWGRLSPKQVGCLPASLSPGLS